MSDPVVEPAGPSETVYLTTADAEGNMFSLALKGESFEGRLTKTGAAIDFAAEDVN